MSIQQQSKAVNRVVRFVGLHFKVNAKEALHIIDSIPGASRLDKAYDFANAYGWTMPTRY